MKASTKIQIEKEIAKLLGKETTFDVLFGEARILGSHENVTHLMIEADGIWFDADSEGYVDFSS